MNNDSNNNFSSSIYRSKALENRKLIDITDTTKDIMDIKWPVAVTPKVWSNYILWTDTDNKRQRVYQDTESRLWYMMFILDITIKNIDKSNKIFLCNLYVIPRDDYSKEKQSITLRTIFTTDTLAPEITIMLPEEN
jgi:hypothetical protein